MDPLVSIIIPVYMVETTLERCLDSVLAQTYTNFEVILVDDGSPDRCGEICDDYAKNDNRFRVIHKENGGLSDARNNGIDRSKGDYLTFIDSDDYVRSNYVEFLLSLIQEEDADMSCGKHNVIYDNAVLKRYTGKKYVMNSREALDMLLYQEDMDVSAWAKMYSRALFSDIRYPVGKKYEDAATTYKLIDKAGKIVLDSRPIYNYVIRDDSITTSQFNSSKIELIDATKEMTEYIRQKYPDLRKACNSRMVYAYQSTLAATVFTEDVDRSIVSKLVEYIRKNGKAVLLDPRVQFRNKIGIVASFFGYGVFRQCMRLYLKIRNRQ